MAAAIYIPSLDGEPEKPKKKKKKLYQCLLLFIFHPSTGDQKCKKKKCILKATVIFQKSVSFYQLYESICMHQPTFYHQT